MLAGDLYDLFRSDVVDTERPYLWSDTEVWAYMNDAYRMFVRLTGGIPDATSDATQVAVTANEPFSEVSPTILKFRAATLLSTGEPIEIINFEDMMRQTVDDYGSRRISPMSNIKGRVSAMVIGMERGRDSGKVRWIHIPEVDDTVQLLIYRLPLETIAEDQTGFDFSEIGVEHVEHLMLWMKARAYGKQDAETFDKGKRDRYDAEFRNYCEAATAEWNQYKHKNRVVAYGGL